MPYSVTSSFDVFRPHNARVTTAKRLPCVRVEGTWFKTGGVKGSAMTVGGLGDLPRERRGAVGAEDQGEGVRREAGIAPPEDLVARCE